MGPNSLHRNRRPRFSSGEENPVARKITAEKKEEEFSANLSEKIQRKKIPF